MKYFISAGEPSGDLHGANLVNAIRRADPAARFAFLGGDLMAGAASTPPLLHIRDMAFMGFSEVLRNLGKISRNMAIARKALEHERPDALILIDYPSFNLRLAKTAASLGIPVYYYIPPKVWAWKEWRCKEIKRLCRRVLCIFPFEVEFYGRRGIEAVYVGNPSVEETAARLASLAQRSDFLTIHDLTSRPILALVPGSRLGEIRNNLPVMNAVARARRDLQGVIAGAPGTDLAFYRQFSTLPVIGGDTLGLMAHARAALVTSGTATLECALAATPQVVCYRANGSRLSYAIMRRLIKVDHVSLPNLIAGKTIIPEMLLHHCTPAEVGAQLDRQLSDSAEILAGYDEMRRRLGTTRAADTAAGIIINDIRK